jgi:peptidoglycan hydrolase-like protein with peptidoglycan-binding domain
VLRILTRAALLGCALTAILLPATALAARHHRGTSGGGSLLATHHRLAHHRVLRRGMRGRDVRALQHALTRAGYPTAADGRFGRHTEAHLRGFERAHGLRAHGVVTRRAWRVLARVEAAPTADSPAQPAAIGDDGALALPAGAPPQVQQIVAAANAIIDHPYRYGGGHGGFRSGGYDCSGADSFALHGGGLLASPEDSTGLESYGAAGPGRWVSVYADAGHAFLVVDGRAFDTADFGGPNIPGGSGPRWRSDPQDNLDDHGDYVVRHPAGL